MGNEGSSGGSTQFQVAFARSVAQAGSVLEGKATLVIGQSDLKNMTAFTAGAVVELQLFGEERTYWAHGEKHRADVTNPKSMVHGDKRRESHKILIDEKQQLRQLSPMEIQNVKQKIELPFSFVLPETLPSSFMYCGDHMSQFKVVYNLNIKLVGLINTGGVPQAQVLRDENQTVLIREREPPVKPGITQESTGELKGTFGNNGKCHVMGNLPVDVAMQNNKLRVTLDMNNSACKKKINSVQFQVHRTIKAYAKTITGDLKEFKDEQVVMLGNFTDVKVAAKEPNIKHEDFNIIMKKVHPVDKEVGRFLMMNDFDTGRQMSLQNKQIQHEILCTMDTELIKVSYRLEAQIMHQGTLSAGVQEIPSMFFPFIVTRDAQGQVDQGTSGHLASQMMQQPMPIMQGQPGMDASAGMGANPYGMAQAQPMQDGAAAGGYSYYDPTQQPGMQQPGMQQPGMMQPGMQQPGMGMQQPGMGQPGMGQPGMGQPGMQQPGMGQPGMGQPGMGQPGMGQPGMGQPGMGQPGMQQPGMGGMAYPTL